MTVRGIRGAISVDADDPDQIRSATRELIEAILERNEISDFDDVISAVFTTPPDLTSCFPAEAARSIGMTTVPVLGVPVESAALKGMDSLLSIVQMPRGVPVGTLAIGGHGATNAALMASQILALNNKELSEKLEVFREEQTAKVAEVPQ